MGPALGHKLSLDDRYPPLIRDRKQKDASQSHYSENMTVGRDCFHGSMPFKQLLKLFTSNTAFCRSREIKACLLSFITFSGDRAKNNRWNKSYLIWNSLTSLLFIDIRCFIVAIFSSRLPDVCLGRAVLLLICFRFFIFSFSPSSSSSSPTSSFFSLAIILAAWVVFSSIGRARNLRISWAQRTNSGMTLTQQRSILQF